MATGRIPSTGQIVDMSRHDIDTWLKNKIMYVNKVGTDGWLQARASASSSRVTLTSSRSID